MKVAFLKECFKIIKSNSLKKEDVRTHGNSAHFYIANNCKVTVGFQEFNSKSNHLYVEYTKEKRRHRSTEDGPAFTMWHSDGRSIAKILYAINGLTHFPIEKGPAVKTFREDGSKKYEEYWTNGNKIRTRFHDRPNHSFMIVDEWQKKVP